jgi:hypothetical protein
MPTERKAEAPAEALARKIADHLSRGAVLLAGAGVSARVGLPTWDQFIRTLAAVCRRFGDEADATTIESRLAKKQYLNAASAYKSSGSIPEGERWKELARPFKVKLSNDDLEKVAPLIALGFNAIVTTNFDQVLHDAYAYVERRQVLAYERGDLKTAGVSGEFFIARIHGHADDPITMAVDLDDYRRLCEEEAYLDFVLHVLGRKSILFVGFSFYDPAIKHLLALYKERVGPTFQALHLAAIPTGQPELVAALKSVNVNVHEYSPVDDHAELWRAIRIVYEEGRRQAGLEAVPAPRGPLPLAPLHQFVAFAYAQIKTRRGTMPLATLAIDGIVASIIASNDGGIALEAHIIKGLAQALRISITEAAAAVGASLRRLIEREQVLREGDELLWCGTESGESEEALDSLAQDVLDRMKVRENVDGDDGDKHLAKEALERLMTSRAWDVAAHFAGAPVGWSVDAEEIVVRTVGTSGRANRGALERSILALLRAPDKKEAELLTTLGRAAFGVQLLMASPRQTLFHAQALPQILYLDANVLMPHITPGHPLRPVYQETISRFRDATEAAGVGLTVVVGAQYLNEIVSHRRLAVEMVRDLKLEDPDHLARLISFRTAVDTNVFVGSYATFVGRAKRPIAFDDFLREIAPYENETDLAAYLTQRGVRAITIDNTDTIEYGLIYGALATTFENSHDDVLRGRKKILVQHEAQQLAQLRLDGSAGTRSLFVTADTRLRRAMLEHAELRPLLNRTTTHLGLVAIADVIIGLEPEPSAFSRLVWRLPHNDVEKMMLNYFVDSGLRNYQEGLAMEMQEAAEVTAKEAAKAAKSENIALLNEAGPAEAVRTSDFLDRYAERFFENWREAIDRRKTKGKN